MALDAEETIHPIRYIAVICSDFIRSVIAKGRAIVNGAKLTFDDFIIQEVRQSKDVQAALPKQIQDKLIRAFQQVWEIVPGGVIGRDIVARTKVDGTRFNIVIPI